MTRRLLLPLFLFFASSLAYSQQANTLTIRFAGAPSGPCAPFMLGVNNATGGEYNCTSGGAWNLIGGGGGGSGTVTSVSFTGGLISVANPTTTPAFTVAGTSGGIPYFSSTSTWASSGLLTLHALTIGGGAAGAPTPLASLGTSTTVLHGAAAGDPTFGSVTSGDIDSTIQPTASPTFTGTVTLPTVTNTGAFTNSFAGAASTPGMTLSGAPFTGGSGTTTFPHLYLNSGAAPTTFSTAGTAIGFNSPSGYTGNFLAYYVNGGASQFSVGGSNGSVSSAGSFTAGTTFTAGSSSFFVVSGRSKFGSSGDGLITLTNNGATALTRLNLGLTTSSGPALGISGTTITAQLGDGTAGGTFAASKYATVSPCSNGASPAVCSAAASGSVAVPTGTNPTLVINTTAVTATSQIFLQIDESATISATTCNTTLSTLVQPVVTARTAATSFTIQIGAVIASNPVCVHYMLVN